MNDEPIRMAGGDLGLSPLDLRAGFEKGSLRDLVSRARLPAMSLVDREDREDALWMANGAYEPKEAFGA